MQFAQDLSLILADLADQDPLYKPTAFWAKAAAAITESLLRVGVETFRRNPQCLGFFVPNYGAPTSGINLEEQGKLLDGFRERNPENLKGMLALEQQLTGWAAALADLRVLQAADDPTRLPRLDGFSESQIGEPLEQHHIDGRRYSRSALNYLLGLAMLKRYMIRHSPDASIPTRVLEVGGGFGTLGEVLSQAGLSGWHYIDIDIPPTGIVAEWYLRQVLGDAAVVGYSETRDWPVLEVHQLPPVAVLAPWQLPRLRGNVDLFVNFISFQEMEPAVVANYLRLVATLKPNWVLLRNLREGKQKRQDPDGLGVDEPILGDDYAQMLHEYALVERGAMPFGYVTVDGFHSELLLFQRRS